MSLTTCIRKAGKSLREQDKAAILALSRQHRTGGMDAEAAGLRAIEDHLQHVEQELSQTEESLKKAPPAESQLMVGITPSSADPVTVRDGVVHIGKDVALNFESGEPVTVPDGAGDDQVKQALIDAGALSRRQHFFGGAAPRAKVAEPTPEYAPDGKARQPQGDYAGGYETDLFGQPVPRQQLLPDNGSARPSRAEPQRANVRWDAQPAAAVPPGQPTERGEDAAANIPGSYYVDTFVSTETSRKVGNDHVRTPAELAQATRYLYRSAVERFDGIVTDRNGKVLAVVGAHKGATTQTSIYGGTVIAEALRVPSAAHIWFSHNHPSGTANLSAADIRLTATLEDLFKGTGIKPMGTIAVTGSKFSFTSSTEHQGDAGRVQPIPEGGKAVEVPVYERELADQRAAPLAIGSPQDAKVVARNFIQKEKEAGLVLLDAQNKVAGWLPIGALLRGKLRDTGGLALVFRALSRSNASSAILVHEGDMDVSGPMPGGPILNIGKALAQVDVRLLDSINVQPGSSSVSRAEKGLHLVGNTLYARGDSAQRRGDEKMPSGISLDEAKAQIKAMRGTAVADAQKIIEQLTSKWKNGPKITVVATVADLPGENPGDVRGLYKPGHIYIVAGAHRAGKDLRRSLARTLAHEAVAHFGLRDMLGRSDWYQLMKNIRLAIESGNKPLAEIQAYIRKAYTNKDGSFTLAPDAEADEIAARAVELAIDADGNFKPGFGFLKAVLAKVAKFLRDLGIDVQFTNAELQGMLVLSMRNMEAGKRTAGGGQLAVAAAREQGRMHLRVFHGTPHQVDRFSTENIGTGEGNQSYGWGLYFAGKKEVADFYRKGVFEKHFIDKAREAYDESTSTSDALDMLRESGDLTPEQMEVLDALVADDLLGFDFPHQALREALFRPDQYDLSERTKAALAKLGKVYEVEIPDDGEYLLWDKSLSEQPEAVKAALAKANADMPIKNQTGQPILPMDPTGQEIMNVLGKGDGASKWLRSFGIRGVKYLDGGSRRKGDGNYNYVIFNDADVQIADVHARGDAFDGSQHARSAATADRADAALPPAPRPLSRWRDATGRLQFAPGQVLYDLIGKAADPLLSALQLKTASPALRRALREMKVEVAKAQETAAAVAGEANKLSAAERAMVSEIVEKELAAGTIPPEHAVRLASLINDVMGKQTDELVRLGMLERDSAEKWRGQYLPRFYESKLTKTAADAWSTAMRLVAGRPRVMKGIGGKHLRGRGLYETIPESQLQHYEAMGWEVRDPDYTPSVPSVDGTVQVWRDFTRAERDKMGEIRDAGFRFVMGYMQTQRDIALGRMFEALAANPEISSRTETEKFSVQVPATVVSGTGAKVYGKLAGRWVSKDTLSHLSQIEEAQSGALRMYRKAMGWWKLGKTAMNPVSHMNNMLSNLTMAHFAGVSYWDQHKYAGAIIDLAKGSPMVKEAKDAGLFLGTLSEEELLNILPRELRDLAKTQEGLAPKVGRTVFDLLTFYLRRPMGWAYQAEDSFFRYLIYRDARSRGAAPADAVDYAQKFIFAYDDLPKGARVIRDFGIPFFSYTFKAAPALLHTALTHPLRFAAPAAVLWATNALSYALAVDDDDDWQEQLRKYFTDAEYRKKARAQQDLEREHLPPWMKGTTALLSPKAIRLGMDEVTKLPLFIDVARIVPGGDMFDVSPNSGGLPIPQPITPSNPLFTTAVAMIGNKDLFFGKAVVDANDTVGEAARKRTDWLWKQLAPSMAYGNYHFERGMNAIAQATGAEVRWLPEAVAPDAVATGIGRDGLPVQPKYAAMQTFGLKVRPIDIEKSEAIDESMRKKMMRDIDTELRSLKRLNSMGAISDHALERAEDLAATKKERLKEGLTVDGAKRD